MRAALAIAAVGAALGAAMIPPAFPEGQPGWSCTARDSRRFAPIPFLAWDRCTQWTYEAAR